MADNIKMGKVVDGELFANNGVLPIFATATVDNGAFINITQTTETPVTYAQALESLQNGQVPVVVASFEMGGAPFRIAFNCIGDCPLQEGTSRGILFVVGMKTEGAFSQCIVLAEDDSFADFDL